MSVLTVADLRERSVVDPTTGCWHWTRAKVDGSPRIWTLDHGRLEKRVMPAPLAVWNIAHGVSVPRGHYAYRACCTTDCVRPSHLHIANSKAAIGRVLAANGKRKGTQLEQRRAAAAKGHASQGIVETPAAVVLEIRQASGETNRAIARRYGLSDSTVSAIRLGKSRCGVAAA